MTKSEFVVAVAVILFVASPALPCSVVGPLPTALALIERTALVLHVRAEDQTRSAGTRGNVLAETPWQIRFRVIDVYKGTYDGNEIMFNGRLEDRDDPNNRSVPYEVVRPGGSSGCYALGYRAGSEYLLFLNRSQSDGPGEGSWTPYWAPLSPTNEQLRDQTDPWLTWVAEQLKRIKPGA